MRFPDRAIFNFDTALRYVPVVRIIEQLKYYNQPILEVGSGTNGISDYYSGEVIGVDSDFSKTATVKNSNIKHIKAIATKLPFKNETFFLTISLDTLEHLSSEKRPKAIEELIRVTKKGGKIFLGFPTGSLSEKFEDKINNLYKRVHGTDHIWLFEHKKYGLPEKYEVLSILYKKGIKDKQVEKFGNVNLLIWFLVHYFFTINPRSLVSRLLKRLYLLIYYISKINLPPFYRVIFIIDK